MNNKLILKVSLAAVAIAIISTANCSGMLDKPNPNAAKGPGITVTSPSSAYSVSEANGTLDLTIVLNTKPADDVTIPLQSSSTKDATVSTPGLTFTSGNWNKPQTITLTGVDNFIVDGNRDISLQFGAVVSKDKDYTGGVKPSIAITVIDNESYSVVVTPTTLTTTEPAASLINPIPIPMATFAVVLGSQPTGNVVIPTITSADTTEGTVSPSTLTFTPANFNVPHVVTRSFSG